MKKVLIKTYGCSFNFSDSEVMAGLLEESRRYKVTDSEEDADLVIINSCTVKNNAETKFWRDVRNIDKPKILAGCVPQAEKDKSRFKGYTVIGTHNISKVVEAADAAIKGDEVQYLGYNEGDKRLNIHKVRKNPIVEIVPINEGCLGSCDYCKTKFARGKLISYPIDEIATHVRSALNSGAKEIWLTSQDTACYGYDIGTNIVELLEALFNIEKDFKIRLGMGNPDFLEDYLERFINAMKNDKMFRFIHIPVQAGSDHVLRSMKRGYDSAMFIRIVEKMKKEIPDLTLATDIICGHPDETNDDFRETIRLVERVRPNVINISRFWARPDTIAAKKKQLPSEVIKERSVELTNLYHKISEEENKRWIGWKGKIIIDEIGKKDSSIGRNHSYKPVILKGSYKIGETLDVEVYNATVHDLRARVL